MRGFIRGMALAALAGAGGFFAKRGNWPMALTLWVVAVTHCLGLIATALEGLGHKEQP